MQIIYIKRRSMNMAHYKKLIGEKVYLSPISMEDIPIFMQWINDMEVTQFVALSHRVYTEVSEREAVERLAKGGNTFTIIDKETDKPIGNCDFLSENMLNRTAEIAITIFEKDYWSKGYGSDALRTLLDFGFKVRNYHNICLRVLSFNSRAIACYEKVGFKRQGVQREVIIRGNEKHDLIYMDILANEYFNTVV